MRRTRMELLFYTDDGYAGIFLLSKTHAVIGVFIVPNQYIDRKSKWINITTSMM